MDIVSLHLSMSHLPIGGGFVVLALLGLAWRLSDARIWLAGLSTVLLVTVFAVGAMTTGPGAQQSAESWFDNEAQDQAPRHELVGRIASYTWVVAAAVAIAALAAGEASPRRRILRGLVLVLVALAFLSSLLAGQTGGRIRHPELRPSSAQDSLDNDAR